MKAKVETYPTNAQVFIDGKSYYIPYDLQDRCFFQKKDEIGDFLIDLLETYCPDFFLVENFAESWNTLADYISMRYCKE